MAQIYDSSHSGQEIDAAVDAVQTTIPSQLTQIGLKIGDLTQLETDDKTSLVDAINEVKSKTSDDLNGNVGSIEGLKKITNTGAVESATGTTNRTLVADVSWYVGQTVSVGGVLYSKSGSTTYCWWAVHDANGNVLMKSNYSSITSPVKYDGFKFQIPENAKYLYVQGNATYIPYAVVGEPYSKIRDYVLEQRTADYADGKNIIGSPDSTLNKIISVQTGAWASASFAAMNVYNVSAGDAFAVTANDTNPAYCYLLTQISDFSSLPSYMDGTGQMRISAGYTLAIDVPSNGYLVVANAFSSSNPTANTPSFVGKAEEDVEVEERTVKTLQLVAVGLRSASNGNPNCYKAYTVGYAHTPKMLRLRGAIKILTDVSGTICWYDSSKAFLTYSSIAYNTEQYNANASYFVISLNDASGTKIIPNEVEVEGIWTGDDEAFWPRPADDGYINLAFVVDVPKNPIYSTSASELTEQFTRTSNHAMLHLPPSYNEDGTPTKLIIYLHGAAERYTDSSTRFGSSVRYSPEWSAAGFAQLDVDMIPDSYGKYTLEGTGGSGDDAACVFNAYQYIISQYNIARDGVYLFGRSRGGQAVLECLAQYDPIKMPVIAALSNSGANSTLIYSVFSPSMNNEKWQFFADAMGLPTTGRPTISSTNKRLIEIANVVTFLRTNIDVWWKKACVALRMVNTNDTEYKTPLQIFNMIVDSYANDNALTYTDWVRSLVLESPVPLRFDWCNGDTTQTWESTTPYNYSVCVKDAFVNGDPKCIYRYWPSIPSGSDAHYHEEYNFYDGDYTLPNGAVVSNPSMAQTEWMLWAMGLDPRFNGSNSI